LPSRRNRSVWVYTETDQFKPERLNKNYTINIGRLREYEKPSDILSELINEFYLQHQRPAVKKIIPGAAGFGQNDGAA